MIKVTVNNADKSIVKIMKNGHEITRIRQNDKLVFSPYYIMGTTYSNQNQQFLSRENEPKALIGDFEVLGIAGSDTDGTYYNFGFRVYRDCVDGTTPQTDYYHNELNYYFSNTDFIRLFRSINLVAFPFVQLKYIPRLQQNLGTLKEVDFKDFSTKSVVNFSPCVFATGCTSILNLNKLKFYPPTNNNATLSWREAFRQTKVSSFDFDGVDSLWRINNSDGWNQTFQGNALTEYYYFPYQEEDSPITELNSTWNGNTILETLDIDPLRFTHLTSLDNTFKGCKALEDIPFTTDTPTSAITSYSQTFRGCESLNPTSWDAISFDSAVSIYYFLQGCKAITSIDWSNKDMHSVGNIDGLFYGCNSLSSVTFPTNTGKILAPKYAQTTFRETAISSIPTFDWSNLLNINAICQLCTGLTGHLDLSSKDMSSINSANGAFYGCNQLTAVTFPSGSNSTSSLVYADTMFERCSNLQYVYNLDLSSLDRLNSTFYLNLELLQVTGTKPLSAVTVNWFLHGCVKLQRFIDMSNLKVKNNSQFGVGSLPSLNNDLHLETWTNEDGTGKPIVWMEANYGFPTITTEDLTHEYNIDPQGWTFLSKQGTNNANAYLKFMSCKYPIINLDKIKVRVMKDSSDNVVPIALESAFNSSKFTEIDTTNWLDNTNVPSLTRLPIYSNHNMFFNCTWLQKIVIKNLDLIESSNTASFGNSKVFEGCSGVTSFTCEYQFFDIVRSQVFDLHYMTQWVNPTEIEAFFNQLTTVTSKNYTATGNNFRFNLSNQTQAVFQGLANYSTIYSAMLSHGWEIV